MLVGKRPGLTPASNRAWVASAPRFSEVVQAGLSFFIDVELANGFHRPSHDGNLSLTEAVDALFHVANDANRRVPCSQRACRVVGVSAASTPQPGQEAVVRRVGVLVFIDDERTVLTTEFAQNGHAPLEVLQQFWSVVEQRQRSGNVSVGPWLITQTVQRINDGRWVPMPADVGAASKK